MRCSPDVVVADQKTQLAGQLPTHRWCVAVADGHGKRVGAVEHPRIPQRGHIFCRQVLPHAELGQQANAVLRQRDFAPVKGGVCQAAGRVLFDQHHRAPEGFECLRQTSPKNNYTFGLSMEFDNEAAYAFYNVHAGHLAFVEGRWLPEVTEFMEIDYIPHTF